ELRSGKTVQEVAGLAGTDTSWIERFLSPILAERRGIVDAVMTGVISRPRQGRSSCNVGQAIVANLRERKAAISPEDLEEGWSVARRNGQWEVTFRYSLRGQHRQAQFAYDPEGGVTAMDEEASVIGWRPSASTRAGAEGRPEGKPAAAPKAPLGAVAAAKPKAKPKPAPRGDVAAATAALWGATKVTPQTAPARRSSFIGVRKTDAGGPSKLAAKAGSKAPARPEPARTPARSEPAKAAGRQPPAQPGTRQPPVPAGQPDKRPPGAVEDRPVLAHNSASPRPKRLITVEDDEADWRSALAKTRAKRKAAAPGPHQGAPAPKQAPKQAPKPAPQPSSRPARPQRKRLPDDWLIGE
ncbi:MAG TPA: septation protein SepH, partial [Actinomycetota bacterium]|nr:septation protein SepH [Actinomycetota bacterium]